MSESTDHASPADQIAAGYALTGPALELGALLWDGTCLPDRQIRIPLSMLNRHGLVAGATGTGKTKTLQLIAEQLSAGGVPVFLADIKGTSPGFRPPARPTRKSRNGRRKSPRSGRPPDTPASSIRSAGSGPAFRSGPP